MGLLYFAAMKPAAIARKLVEGIADLEFSAPVTHVYNPLVYAQKSHEAYLRRYGTSPKEVLLLGMNPGPWGMAQTGVPFGDVAMVRDWLGIETAVSKPAVEHPKRPVLGFDCTRQEVSGTRLWGWARDRFGRADDFFERFFVWNYCPLCFMEESGRNFVPEKLKTAERDALFAPCDLALRRIVEHLKPLRVIGIGKFAEKRARAALAADVQIGDMLHPSPASPAANKNWAKAADAALAQNGIRI